MELQIPYPTNLDESSQNDRISNLPNCVISHILSFLPTLESICTCALSSRWKDLWKDVIKLSFDSNCSPSYNDTFRPDYDKNLIDRNFVNFLERALILYDNKSLDKFSFVCREVSERYDVNRWFNWAIMRGLQSLDFSMNYNTNFELPRCIYNCMTLQELILCNVVIAAHDVCLPNLKKLELKRVWFKDDDSANRLICSCTSLESLVFVLGGNFQYTKLNILSSTLRELRSAYHGELALDAPALEYLDLTVFQGSSFHIKNLSSLEEACIDFYLRGYEVGSDPCWPGVANILQAICNAKTLTISINANVHVPGYAFPIFHRLTKLHLTAHCGRWRLLFFKNSNKLRHAYTFVWSQELHTHELCWRNPSFVPTCFISSLTNLTIAGFTNSKREQAMAEYIVQKARVLKRMKVCSYSYYGSPNIKKFGCKLLNLRRASKECEVLICESTEDFHNWSCDEDSIASWFN